VPTVEERRSGSETVHGSTRESEGHRDTGRDVDGAEVVIHEILPDEVEVRALDLRPAPELKIGTITAAQGSCNQPVSAR
jgi:hypothetical protein